MRIQESQVRFGIEGSERSCDEWLLEQSKSPIPSPFVDCQCFQFFLWEGLFIFSPSFSAFLHLLFPDINHSLECRFLPSSHSLYHCSFILLFLSLSLTLLLPCIHIPDLLFCIHKSVFLSSRTIRRIFPIPPGIHPSILLSDRIFRMLISPNDDDDPTAATFV